MLILTGRPVAPGVAVGQAFVYRDILQEADGVQAYDINDAQISLEQTRVDKAAGEVRRSLLIDAEKMAGRVGEKSAEIFLAQAALLSSPSIVEELKRILETERINAEQVVLKVFKALARQFRETDIEALQTRGDDIDDLYRRLQLAMAGIHAHRLESLRPNTVLVARRLFPSDTVFLSRQSTVAVLAEFAGPAAHAALLARELGIPCVGEIPQLTEIIDQGDMVAVDGATGEAVINPDSATLQYYKDKLSQLHAEKSTRTLTTSFRPAITLDGTQITVMANVRSREDVEIAMKCGAEGIGLFRTEPFFLSSKHFPSEEEFEQFLLHSLVPARGKQIALRLLDIGADKNPIYLHLPSEPDPFLGRRGVRLLLEFPDLLDAQLRAMLKVSRQIPISISIPMVTTVKDVTEVSARLRRIAAEMSIHELPPVGAMVETPAAALSVPALKPHVDFFSIGSNDLTQYTMAAGRENPTVTGYFVDDHPSVLRLIEIIVRESGDTPVSLCGELAGRVNAMARLLTTGIRSLSVPASLVQDVQHAIRQTSLSSLGEQNEA